MDDTRPKAETTPFWRFSLHFYRRSGVSDACIALQDNCGVDVNLLLFLFWLAAGGRLLSADEVTRLDEKVRDWRNLTIIPIRDARRKLKDARTLVEPAKQEDFRTKVKAIELDAERLQQEALYRFARSGPLGEAAVPEAAVRANFSAYESMIGGRFPGAAVDVLLNAFNSLKPGELAAASSAGKRE